MEVNKYIMSTDERYIITPEGEYIDIKDAVSYLNNFKDKVEDLENYLKTSIKYLKITSNMALNLFEKPPEGLSREFYHTLSYEGDLNLRLQAEKAKEFAFEVEAKLVSRREL